MREDISSIVSATLAAMNTNNVVDLDRVLTKAVCFDAAVMRAFLLDSSEDESDMEDFFDDMSFSGIFKAKNFGIRHSHAEIVEMFDAAAAHSIERSL